MNSMSEMQQVKSMSEAQQVKSMSEVQAGEVDVGGASR